MINDFDVTDPSDKEKLEARIYTYYDNTDTIQDSARCDCGALTGMFNEGIKCGTCNTEVVSTANQPIEPSVWFTAPSYVTRLISPQIWAMMERYLTVSDYDFLLHLTDPDYRPAAKASFSQKTKEKIAAMERLNIPRGINHFIDNFKEIVTLLIANKVISVTRAEAAELLSFIDQQIGLFFPKQIPLPSKIFFVIESTTSGVYVDQPLVDAMDVIHTITGIKSSPYTLKKSQIESRTARALSQLTSFYKKYTYERLVKKPALFRRHVYGGRLFFSARAVITSLSDPHDGNELHLPWSLSIQLFKYHLISKLQKRQFSMKEAISFITNHVYNYHPLMEEIFNELIDESPNAGPSVILHRNPTLKRGSTQRFYVTKIKTNPDVNTISLSALNLRPPNADFDGDALNLWLATDQRQASYIEALAPHNWAMSVEDPGKLSGDLKLQGPVLDTITAWLAHPE